MPAYEYLAEESITPKSLIDDTNTLPGEVTIELDDIVVAEKIPPLVVKKVPPPKDGLFKSAAKVIGNQVSNLSGGIASAVTMGIFKWGDEDSVAFIAADWLTPVPQGKIGKALKGIRQLASRTKKANKPQNNSKSEAHGDGGRALDKFNNKTKPEYEQKIRNAPNKVERGRLKKKMDNEYKNALKKRKGETHWRK